MTSLAGKSVLILAANGFDENHMSEIQRALVAVRATFKTVAPESGVVNGWQGDHWGHHFPVDLNIGEALGSDFDFLVIPGGERAAAKLKTNLHARRIINHFLEAEKPIAAIEAGVALLALSPRVAGLTVSAPEQAHKELHAAGAIAGDTAAEISETVLTANGEDVALWVKEAVALFAAAETEELQAA